MPWWEYVSATPYLASWMSAFLTSRCFKWPPWTHKQRGIMLILKHIKAELSHSSGRIGSRRRLGWSHLFTFQSRQMYQLLLVQSNSRTKIIKIMIDEHVNWNKICWHFDWKPEPVHFQHLLVDSAALGGSSYFKGKRGDEWREREREEPHKLI